MDLLLASTSPIRRQLLTEAGVVFEAVAPEVDEDAIKAGHAGSDPELATALAAAKAFAVSRRFPDALAIGSDSIISVDGCRFSKPEDRAAAAEHLRFFSGRSLQLTSAVALAAHGEVAWRHVSRATLEVRSLSDEFINRYLEVEWPDVAYCVGAFRLEGHGVQLFDRIEGDHFTILGLPLLPLLAELRARGAMPS